jgi:dienelactone hydrolase
MRNRHISVWVLLLTLGATAMAEQAADKMPWPMDALRKPPAITWRNQTGRVRSLLYRGMAYEGKPTSVFAYYATPGTLSYGQIPDRNLPAVIFIHGGGGRASAEVCELWARRGYAALAMDLAGCSDEKMPDNLALKRLPDGGPSQDGYKKIRDIGKPMTDQWPFHAVANVVLANSLLRSFLEIDPNRIGVTGSSWGGFTTCLAAGVDTRFAAAAPVYGCGYIYEHSVWHEEMKLFAEMTPENRERWIALWDPSRYIGKAAMPMLFLGGASDFAYPLESFYKTYTTAPAGASRWLCLHAPLPHDDWTAASAREVEIFMDQCLRNGPPLPKVGQPVVGKEAVTASVTAPVKLRAAALYYTNDKTAKKWSERKWTRLVGRLVYGQANTPLPPAECYAWYIGVTDERGCEAASPVIFAGSSAAGVPPPGVTALKGVAFLNANWDIECIQDRYQVVVDGRTGRMLSLMVDGAELLSGSDPQTAGLTLYDAGVAMKGRLVQILVASTTGQQVAAMDGNFGLWYHFLPDAIIVEYAANTANEPALLVALSSAVQGIKPLETLEDRHLQGHARHEGWVIGTQGVQLVTGLPTMVAIQGITPQWVTDWMRQPVQGVRLAFPMKKRVAMEIQIGPATVTENP